MLGDVKNFHPWIDKLGLMARRQISGFSHNTFRNSGFKNGLCRHTREHFTVILIDNYLE